MQMARGGDPTLPRAELDLRTEEYKHGSARHSSLCKDPPHPRIWCNSCPRVWYADSGSPRDRTGNQDRIGSGVSSLRLLGALSQWVKPAFEASRQRLRLDYV